jgi:hypothetical protein
LTKVSLPARLLRMANVTVRMADARRVASYL